MFEEYNPLKGKRLQILDDNGKIINKKYVPNISNEKLVEALKLMIYSRLVDLKSVSYQRQGRMYTYPPNLGQEASALATGMILRDEDWLVPAYRELSAWLHKGITPKDLYLFWGGNEAGLRFPEAKNVLPFAVPIASQYLHATGIGYALKYQKKDALVVTYIGDGGTSEGDFHEALNFAGVWDAPVLFVCQNNQYAISLPREKQTRSESIAIKSVAYGIKGIQVDGNDFLATYSAALHAAEYIRAGNGPVLIEAVTYRMGAHTTSDDPTKYRTTEEEENWKVKDPIRRLKAYLISKKLWNEKEEEKLKAEYEKEIDLQFEASKKVDYKLDEVFQYTYTDMPDDLKNQKIEYEKFLSWKEAHSWQ